MPKTEVLKVDPASPDQKAIKFAATILRNGGLVAFPTETVYGIGANFLDEKAIDRLYKIKKRPREKPFTVHIASVDTLRDMRCEISPLAGELIKRFWPGPLTIILKSSAVGLGGRTGKLGFRMPANRIAKMFIGESKVPVAAPSANISGQEPPTAADRIAGEFSGKIDLILDGGETTFGKESTVVDASSLTYKILRKGAIPEEEIAEIYRKI